MLNLLFLLTRLLLSLKVPGTSSAERRYVPGRCQTPDYDLKATKCRAPEQLPYRVH